MEPAPRGGLSCFWARVLLPLRPKLPGRRRSFDSYEPSASTGSLPSPPESLAKQPAPPGQRQVRCQGLGGTVPIMRDDGHLLAKSKQFVHMRGLCLFEPFEGLIAVVLGSGRTLMQSA